MLAALAPGDKVFLCGATNDVVASTCEPLCQLGVGHWLDGPALQKAQKKVKLPVQFKFGSEDDLAKFVVKGQMNKKFPEEPMPLYKFLMHLESERIVATTLANHSIDRRDTPENAARSAKKTRVNKHKNNKKTKKKKVG